MDNPSAMGSAGRSVQRTVAEEPADVPILVNPRRVRVTYSSGGVTLRELAAPRRLFDRRAESRENVAERLRRNGQTHHDENRPVLCVPCGTRFRGFLPEVVNAKFPEGVGICRPCRKRGYEDRSLPTIDDRVYSIVG
jgi:hypothetical protein